MNEQEIRNFIQDHIDLLVQGNVAEFYEVAKKNADKSKIGYIFGYLLQNGINVLDYLNATPSYCFASSELTNIDIPTHIDNIGDHAFSLCSRLTSITYQGTKSQWCAISKGNSWNYNTGAYTVHCTDGDIKKNEWVRYG